MSKPVGLDCNFDPFGPNLLPKLFSLILILLDVIHCCKLSWYAISKITNDPNLRKLQKQKSFGSNSGSFGPNLGPKIIFIIFSSNKC